MNRKSVGFVLVLVAALLAVSGTHRVDAASLCCSVTAVKTMKVSLQADGAEPVGVVNLRPAAAPSR